MDKNICVFLLQTEQCTANLYLGILSLWVTITHRSPSHNFRSSKLMRRMCLTTCLNYRLDSVIANTVALYQEGIRVERLIIYFVMWLVSPQANINKSALILMSNYHVFLIHRNQSISYYCLKKAIVTVEFDCTVGYNENYSGSHVCPEVESNFRFVI